MYMEEKYIFFKLPIIKTVINVIVNKVNDRCYIGKMLTYLQVY